jgi:large subunit ribosomal protein L4
MPVVDIVNLNREKVSEVELSDAVWGVPVRVSVLHQVVCAQLASRRQGTASTKGRSEIRGSGRKPFRQKGTGRARAGTKKSPLWRGGGITFGPKPRSYEQKVPKKVRRLALCMALTDKYNSNKVVVLDEFLMQEIKTKRFVEAMQGLQIENALILVHQDDVNMRKSSRNVPHIKVLRTDGLNVYDILKYENLVVLSSALEKITERLAPNERTA